MRSRAAVESVDTYEAAAAALGEPHSAVEDQARRLRATPKNGAARQLETRSPLLLARKHRLYEEDAGLRIEEQVRRRTANDDLELARIVR